MVKPYKIEDSVICDNLISIETRGKSKPIIPNNSTVLLSTFDQNNMANETATTNEDSGKASLVTYCCCTFFHSNFHQIVCSSDNNIINDSINFDRLNFIAAIFNRSNYNYNTNYNSSTSGKPIEYHLFNSYHAILNSELLFFYDKCDEY